LKRYILVTAMICAAAGCTEEISTAPDLGFLQVFPRTGEVLIPFEDFVDAVQVFGGFGSTADIGRGWVSSDLDGLNARTLVWLDDYPLNSDQSPGALTFSDGRLVLFFDSLAGELDDPVDVEVFLVEEEWHPPSVTWEFAVDTTGGQRAWSQPGGGVTTFVGGGIFNPDASDSLSIPIDSVTVASLENAFGEPTLLLVSAVGSGVSLQLVDMAVNLNTTTSLTETIFEERVPILSTSFIFDPPPAPPSGWLRVGGTPAWRSVLTMSLPREVTGTPEICGSVGCAVDLTEVHLNLAELVLTSRQTELAFQPQDTTKVDIRPVLNPELLPKSPLGDVVALPKLVPRELFAGQGGTQVFFPVTPLLVQILDIAAVTGTVPTTSIALFTNIEPRLIGFASFEGGGGAGAPALRLLYTIANPVGLP
jgi:hypothetical protein